MFLLKLVLTPLFAGAISLAGRRWGAAASGWLAGLPLTSAPVSIFLLLEQGPLFAARAAQGTLLGVVSLVAFCLTYSWLSLHLGMPLCVVFSLLVSLITTFLLTFITPPLILTCVLVFILLLLLIRSLPRDTAAQNVASVSAVHISYWEILGRMVVATLFVLLLTESATLVGPHISGLLSPFPIYATILAAFSHHFEGAYAARRVLRGVSYGAFAFSTFFLIVSTALPIWNAILTYIVAAIIALSVQGCSLWFLRHRTSVAISQQGKSEL